MTVRAIHDEATAGAGEIDSELREALTRQQQAFRDQPFPSLAQRKDWLLKLLRMVRANRDAFAQAISDDFTFRSPKETDLVEVMPVVMGIQHMARHLSSYMSPQRRRVHPAFWRARARVEYQPLGVIGIISPWNYPLQLALCPLADALAAGNRAMLKPSELTPRFSELLADLIESTFPADLVTVCTGGVDVAQAFSSLAFDHLVFTGSTNVGKIVMRAAAENLTPVTLELGGKSPLIIDEGYPLGRSMDILALGKTTNAGQTCVAPDYAFVHESQRDELVRRFQETIAKCYPSIASSEDYTAIASDRHHARLLAWIEDARDKGATIVECNPGGDSPEELGRKIPPTLILDATDEMTVLQEEIFGPLLPIKTYRRLDEVVEYITARPHPLAMYVFSERRDVQRRFIQETSAGGMCLNATLMHVGAHDLPFGGVGHSGTGAYHGLEGFERFSHKKSIFELQRLNGVPLLVPPFGDTFRVVVNQLIGR